MSEYIDERADDCEHVNVREEAGGMLLCDDCGESRQGALWRSFDIPDDETSYEEREIDRQAAGRWDK